ncbi:MAG: hypothetical protein ACI9KE_004362 [Polyangiales bacterium]|jgi:hypothetical protein
MNLDESIDAKDAKEAEQAADNAECSDGMDSLQVTFNTLILSMSTGVLVQLGDAPDEIFGGETPPPANLPMAKHSIDVLALLEEKTQGNLTGEEERLLGQLLYDLRLRYVSACENNS